jgi:phenylpropionate dioxygenase-like ring-hydroxylating dioxygenase large terminal subunit
MTSLVSSTANETQLLSQDKPLPSSGAQSLAAGGPDPDRFNWTEVWYPLHYVQDLDRMQPTAFTLLGEDLVIWWEPTVQQWRVFADQCPHRLARLSEGRVSEAGQLECPYHGWAFSGSGTCESIPQLTGNATALESPRACVRSLPTKVVQGLLFAYPGKAENAEQTAVPFIEAMEEDAADWICINTFRDLPYDVLTLMENVLDASHVPYTHHNTVGNRTNAAPVELEVVEAGKQGFTGVWAEGPRRGTLGRQDTRFIAPNFMWHDLTSKQFGRTLTVVYGTPTRKGECRLFARFPFKFSSKLPKFFIGITPRWYSHINQNKILEDDQIFLHHQERYLAQSGGSSEFTRACYLPTAADRYVAQLHQWLNQFDANPFPQHSLPPSPPTRAQLLDRYHSHTIHCASCRGALKNIQRLKIGAGMGAAIAWSLMPVLMAVQSSPWAAIGISSLALALFGSWFALRRLERKFYEGQMTPPRNLPDPKKKR